MNDVARRVPQFFLSIALCSAMLWIFNFGHFLLFKLLAVILIVTACNELCAMFHLKKTVAYCIVSASMLLPCLLLVSQYIEVATSLSQHFLDLNNVLLFFLVGTTLLIVLHKDDSRKGVYGPLFKSIFVLLLSVVYLASPLYLLISVSQFDNALLIYLLPILTVAVLDTSSYLCGRLFGGKSRHIFHLSPNKTSVGVACGIILTFIVVYTVITQLHPTHDLFDFKILLLIIIMVAAGIIGDLFGSLLKRIAHVKDSGTLVRGRGGVIDSIDSLLFVMVIFWSLSPVLMPIIWH